MLNINSRPLLSILYVLATCEQKMSKNLLKRIPNPRKRPIEIEFEDGPIKQYPGVVKATLATLVEIEVFWKKNMFDYAVTGLGSFDNCDFIVEGEWYFSNNIIMLMKALHRWNEMGMKLVYKKYEPSLLRCIKADDDHERKTKIEHNSWTQQEELFYQKSRSWDGYWVPSGYPEGSCAADELIDGIELKDDPNQDIDSVTNSYLLQFAFVVAKWNYEWELLVNNRTKYNKYIDPVYHKTLYEWLAYWQRVNQEYTGCYSHGRKFAVLH